MSALLVSRQSWNQPTFQVRENMTARREWCVSTGPMALGFGLFTECLWAVYLTCLVYAIHPTGIPFSPTSLYPNWVSCHVFEQMGPPTFLEADGTLHGKCRQNIGRLGVDQCVQRELWSSEEIEWESGEEKLELTSQPEVWWQRYDKGGYR